MKLVVAERRPGDAVAYTRNSSSAAAINMNPYCPS